MPEPRRNDDLFERFQLIANAPALFNAIVAGLDLDLFGLLAERGEATLDDVHASTGVPPHKLRVLLLALCSTGLVDKDGDVYRNSAVAEEHLSTDDPDSWRHILIGWQRIYYPAFAHTTRGLRAGTNEAALADYTGAGGSLYARLSHDRELESVFHAAMSAFTLQSMPGLVENAELSAVRSLLDVGGGDGTTAVSIARRSPEARVTVFDLPSVVKRAGEALPADLAERVLFRAGDMFEEDFPTGCDAVLFSHVLEVFSEERILRLLSKAYEALPSGGKVFLYGYNAAPDESGGIISARLSLYLNILASGEGMAYPATDYEGWLRRVGFTRVRTYDGLPYEHGLQVAVKD
ncbi:methyltransferase [Nocardiopsis halophila]|uniref:methyltransferase n=1 Tax=Nocardiopsis halophila TaxID=141692 RepID=UPI00034CCCCD|nr:methyltransferase [Nocardiopsis halophila]